MCVFAPVLAAVGGLSGALSAIGTVVSVVGTLASGMAAASNANFQAKIASMNAQFAEQRAQDAITRANDAEQRHRMKVAQLYGSQLAGFGAAGIVVGAGTSAFDELGNTVKMGELDALEIRRNGELEAFDYRVQGFNFQAEAATQRAAAGNAVTSSVFDAVGVGIKGATSVLTARSEYASYSGGS